MLPHHKPSARYLFFGRGARPISEVVMRRHPLAMSLYLVVFLLGMIFVTHFGYGQHTETQLFPGVSPWAILGWKVMMVSGGGGAFLVLCLNPRPSPHWPDLADLLHLEGIAALVAAFGMATYLVAVVKVSGHQSGPSLAFFIPLITGHVLRGFQAMTDSRRLETLAQLAVNHFTAEEREHVD